MNQVFGENSPLVIAVLKLTDIVFLTLMWLICSIPLITIGISTTTFYEIAYKDLWHSRGRVMRDFVHALKRNAKQSFGFGALMAVFFAILIYDIAQLRMALAAEVSWGKLWWIPAVLLVLAIVYFLWVCANIARFDAPLKQILKNAAALAVTHFPVSIGAAVITAAAVVLIWLIPAALFIVPSFAMLLICMLTNAVFRLYMSDEEKALEDERNHPQTDA